MKVQKIAEIAEQKATSPLFTGGMVTSQRLVTPEMSKNFTISVVNFVKGSRNKFHAHTSDQVLIVTAGRGIVATDREQVNVGVGDVIFFPAGEKHWHGATQDTDFSHIYVTAVDSRTTQLED
ncbi:MAG: cupin domain-containing protein [Chloroflexota bacterium]